MQNSEALIASRHGNSPMPIGYGFNAEALFITTAAAQHNDTLNAHLLDPIGQIIII